VHEFTRSTSQPTAVGVARMLGAALGWMQAYQGALNEGQWQADVARASAAQAKPNNKLDGMVHPQTR
jgi:hypothetical protein